MQFMAARVLKTFLMTGLISTISITYADTTTHGYSSPRKNFCNSENENGAEQLLKELDDINKEKFRESESLKRELNQSIGLMKIVKDYLKKKEDLINEQTVSIDSATESTLKLIKDAKQNETMPELVTKICGNMKVVNGCSDTSVEPVTVKEKVGKKLVETVMSLYTVAHKPTAYLASFQSLYSDDHLKEIQSSAASVKTKDSLKSDLDYVLKSITAECAFKISQEPGLTDQEMVDQFKEYCKNDSIYDIDNIKSKSKLAGNIADKVEQMNNRVEQLKVIHADEDFNKVEVFKSYIAKKYLCMCGKDSGTPEVYVQRTCYNYESHNQISTPAVLKLANAVSAVIADMRFSQDFGSLQNKCSENSDRDILSVVANNCKKIGDDDIFKKVCQIASGEQSKKEDSDARMKRWDDLNRDYWIKKDSNAKDGFIKTEKKKTWELIGEGLKPSLTSIVPVWFNNYQMKSNINMLTQQALAEKQYNHTIDIYNQNPWMYGYPFTFQSNFFPIYNPYSTTDVFGTSTTGTTSTANGYNFSTGTP